MIATWTRAWALAFGLVLGSMPAGSVRAEWLRAETPRFVVYADGTEANLREHARQLEMYDSVLRFLHGVDIDGAPPRRLTVYLLKNDSQLDQVRPGSSNRIAGFYSASTDDVFAVALRERGARDETDVLLHEYAHHFMLQHFASGYPTWLVEGYAEYFMTAELEMRRVTIGEVHPSRGYHLGQRNDWLDWESILTTRPFQDGRDRDEVGMFYAQSWLLAHWFLSNPERGRALERYVTGMSEGLGSVEAMEAATGMGLSELDRAMRDYAGGRVAIRYFEGTQFGSPEIRVSRVDSDESALLLLGLRLKGWIAEADQAGVLAEARRRAGPYRESPFGGVILARAEILLGDPDQGDATLMRLLELNPEHVEALSLLAESRMQRADAEDADPDQRVPLMREARDLLARAYQADPDRYQTLYQLSLTRRNASSYPSDNDMETLLAAYDLAPQVGAVRVGAAEARLLRREYAEAIALLQPLAASPHEGEGAPMARRMIEQARSALGEATPEEEEAAPEGAAPEDAPPGGEETTPA